MDVLTSRLLLRPTEPRRSHAFYRDLLGLAVIREFGPPGQQGVVYSLGGGGLLEVSGRATAPPTGMCLWLQVRQVEAEHDRLAAAGVAITRGPVLESWGLVELWLADPDGVPIVLVEIPAGHPLRADQR